MHVLQRSLKIDLEENNAFFLWGPRKTGKTTYLKSVFQRATWFDLLDTTLQAEFAIHPYRFREIILASHPALVIIDEFQKAPRLLDEVHWCLENTSTKFILCGSSARALKRDAANLLGGRAWRYEMHPLTSQEIPEFDLFRALNNGLLPQHYFSSRPNAFLKGYLLEYMYEEIQKEARIRHIASFERFLDMVAKSHGQLINYSNIARDCGVSSPTVRSYFQILEDTLLGFRLPPWRESKSRRLIETEKFYLFDVGLVKYLLGLTHVEPGTDVFGHFFEHFIIQEIRAYCAYREKLEKVTFWRTTSQLEVDIIVGSMKVAIECKATTSVRTDHLKGLIALMAEEKSLETAIVVSLDPIVRRREDGIWILPYSDFLHRLWMGELF